MGPLTPAGSNPLPQPIARPILTTRPPASTGAQALEGARQQGVINTAPGAPVPLDQSSVQLTHPKPSTISEAYSLAVGKNGVTSSNLTQFAVPLNDDNSKLIQGAVLTTGQGAAPTDLKEAHVQYTNLTGLVNSNNTGGHLDAGYTFGIGVVKGGENHTKNGADVFQDALATYPDGHQDRSSAVKVGHEDLGETVDKNVLAGRAYVQAGATYALSPTLRVQGAIRGEVQGNDAGVVGIGTIGARLEKDLQLGGAGVVGGTTVGAQGVFHISTNNFAGTDSNKAYALTIDANHNFGAGYTADLSLSKNSQTRAETEKQAADSGLLAGTAANLRVTKDLGSGVSINAGPSVGFDGQGASLNLGITYQH